MIPFALPVLQEAGRGLVRGHLDLLHNLKSLSAEEFTVQSDVYLPFLSGFSDHSRVCLIKLVYADYDWVDHRVDPADYST